MKDSWGFSVVLTKSCWGSPPLAETQSLERALAVSDRVVCLQYLEGVWLSLGVGSVSIGRTFKLKYCSLLSQSNFFGLAMLSELRTYGAGVAYRTEVVREDFKPLRLFEL